MQRKNFIKLALALPIGFATRPFLWLMNNNSDFVSNANVSYFKKGDADYELLRKGFNKRINKCKVLRIIRYIWIKENYR